MSVYHLAPHPVSYQNSTALTFSPTALTLIQTATDAVLIDAPVTIAQGAELTSWVQQTIQGKQLKGIMVTHGHGDHFFSAPRIIENFPGAKIFVDSKVLAHMHDQYEPFTYESVWSSLFPGGQIASANISDGLISLLDEADPKVVLADGHELQVVQVGQSDTYNSTVIHVPSLDLVVGGDVIYGSCHQALAEDATPELRQAWRISLEEAEKLCPTTVVPSHMVPSDDYSPTHIHETRRYIDTWEVESAKASTWEELEDARQAAFPGRDGSFILRYTSQAPFNATF